MCLCCLQDNDACRSMPRRAVVLTGPVDDADLRAVQAINDCASDTTKRAERLLGYLEAFIREQPEEVPDQDNFERFIGRLSRNLQPNTVRTYVETMNSYGIYPGKMDVARERIRRARFLSGIKRRDEERGIPDRTATGELSILRRLVEEVIEGDGARELEYRSFFYVQVATGGRPENILHVLEFEAKRDELMIKWGRRKVRPPNRSYTAYYYDWSFAPPEDVMTRINDLKKKKWLFSEARQMASSLCSWLDKRCRALSLGQGIKVTSTAGRARLSTLLYALYESGAMTAEKYSDLMDHEPSMSRQRYQAVTM